ncbi:hypothetical protein ACLKMH_10805 [Psychromonas sp. KJ10-10]|uniref:hypothetical protein n=1 Tax=Psychromonas sp. KJ10-10 TaxID=3391823 RepID=UPI0039B6BAD8
MSIDIKPLAPVERKACPETFSFGENFADHMFTQAYNPVTGWNNAEIKPYQSISLDPSVCGITLRTRNF